MSAIDEQLDRIDRQIAELREERRRLAKQHGRLPILHYWRYSFESHDEYDGSLEDAFRYLKERSDDGELLFEGIIYKGQELTFTELYDRFGDR